MDHVLAIRAFARVVEAGNFTKASQSLDQPKATVSKLVQQLESHLGVQLLARTTRRVTVTPEGEAYYERSTRLVRELEDLDTSFAATKGAPRGRLRVNVGSSIASSILIPALPDFAARFPEIRLDLGVGDRDVDLVADNVDCVVRGGIIADASLVARLVTRLEWVTCATPAYVKAHGAPKHPRDLETGHRVVNYVSARTGRVLPMRFREGSGAIELSPRHAVGVNESNAHFAAGLAGLGIVQTFEFLARGALARGELVPVLARYQPKPYDLHVAYPPNRHISHRVRVFIDWLVGAFRHV